MRESFGKIQARRVVVCFIGLAIVLVLGLKIAPAQGLNEAVRLNQQASELNQQGRYTEAESLYKRSLKIFEKALGPDHPYFATSMEGLANLYQTQGRYTDAERLHKRALEIRRKALDSYHPAVASSLNNLATLYHQQGQYDQAEPFYKRALEIRERALGPDHLDVATLQSNLAVLYQEQARYTEAERLHKHELEIREKTLGPDHPLIAQSLNNLASFYWHQGRYAEAEPLFKRSREIMEKALGPNHSDVALLLSNMATVYSLQAKHKEAEQLYKRAWVILEKALGPEHIKVALSIDGLANVYSVQGRFADAEPLYKRALAIREKALGPAHPEVAIPLYNLALLYERQDRFADAEPLFKRALAIREKALGPAHPTVGKLLSTLASVYSTQGRFADAELLYQRSLEILEKAAPNHTDFASLLGNLAEHYRAQGRYADAEPLIKRSLATFKKALNSEHFIVVEVLNGLAALYDEQGRYEDAMPVARQVINQGKAPPYPTLKILMGAQKADLISQIELFDSSYLVLQSSFSSAVSEAVKKVAQRFAAGTGDLAKMVRKDQDLQQEAEALDRNLIAAVSKTPEERNATAEENLRKRLGEITLERKALENVLRERFSDYVALANPPPLSLEDTQKLLTDDEAIVAFHIGEKRSYAWVVTKTSADWVEIPATATDLAFDIKKLRWSLTFDRSGRDVPFDSALAYSIYKKTFGPIAEKLKGKTRLSVLANGALTSIPFGLLITSDPEGKALKDVDWLIKSYAVTVIPSIYSLKTMRAHVAAVGAEKPMIAFADPVFSEDDPEGEEKQVAQRSLSHFYRGSQLDAKSLAEALPQLPGTRIEVDRIAKGLNVPKEDLKFGREATETAVKQSKLDDYRVVYFATHGLVAGDLEEFAKSKAEPALALTFPDEPDDMDNGLLEASEIAKLKMDAEWVVLSACNTASSDGVRAEPLSGLARAFLYAGGRSLVVSHWDVSDDATAELMSNLFEISKEQTHALPWRDDAGGETQSSELGNIR